jgi:hypothetical protein
MTNHRHNLEQCLWCDRLFVPEKGRSVFVRFIESGEVGEIEYCYCSEEHARRHFVALYKELGWSGKRARKWFDEHRSVIRMSDKEIGQ